MIDEEIEEKIEDKKLNFDFLTDKTPQTLTVPENSDWIKSECLVVIVKSSSMPADFDLCGKKMIDWVRLATSCCKQKVIDDLPEEELLYVLKQLCEDFSYVAVLYQDTPLLQKNTFLEIMKHFSMRKMNVMKLPRGYVFRKEYLQNAKIILSSAVENFGEKDFFVVDNAKKVGLAFKTLNQRILDYHKENGVIFYGENTIFIDADVEIEAGTVIYPNNILKGESYIGANVILESGNYILDTIVCEGAFVCQSYLEKSKVEKGKVVGPFAKLVSEKV